VGRSLAVGDQAHGWEMSWNEFVVTVAVLAIGILPGFWLYRDVARRNKNVLVWIVAYALALATPRRFLLVPLVFAAWFLLRDGFLKKRWRR
jgi:hypothetical protein